MKPEEFNALSPLERDTLDEMRKIRVALELISKIWEKMAEQ